MQPVDLTTFAGLAAAVAAITEILKATVPQTRGKEKLVSLGLSIALGIAAKVSGLGFGEMDWLTFMLTLLMMSATSGAIHKHVMPASKKTPEDPPQQ